MDKCSKELAVTTWAKRPKSRPIFLGVSVNAIASARPGRGQPCLGALADQISFELGEYDFSETRGSPNSGPVGDHRTHFLRKVHNRLAGFVEETKPLLCLPAGGRTRRLAGDPLAAR
jgi:hypothetical protein